MTTVETSPTVSTDEQAEAERRHAEALEAASTTRTGLLQVTQHVSDLEAEVASGVDVDYLTLAKARHEAEVLTRRLEHQSGQAQAALREAHAAQARSIAREWDRTAPQLRAEIREAAEEVAAARQRLTETVRRHNDFRASTLQALANAGQGADKLPQQPTRPIALEGVLALALSTRPQEVVGLALQLPPDVVPTNIGRTKPFAPGVNGGQR